jgi:hypothetical protein
MLISKFGGKASSVGDHKASGELRRFGEAHSLGGDKVMSGLPYWQLLPSAANRICSLCRASKDRIIW